MTTYEFDLAMSSELASHSVLRKQQVLALLEKLGATETEVDIKYYTAIIKIPPSELGIVDQAEKQIIDILWGRDTPDTGN